MILISLSAGAQKIDTIIHVNGNVLTGDFKKMEYGIVTWKMDGMGTISFEEPKISTIISKKEFEIKLESGELYFASFEASREKQMVYLVNNSFRKLVRIDDIVEVHPIKNDFLMRTSGNLSLGANYSKGSNVATVAFSGNFRYKKRKQSANLYWDTNQTYQGDSLSATKTDIMLSWQRTISGTWATNLTAGLGQNRELGTKLRQTLDITGIKDIVYNEWNRLYAGAGINLARETPYEDADITNDVAGLIQVKWKVYKLTTPKVWVDADFSFLPYFTDPGRNRMSFNLTPKVGLFGNNFKIGLSFYYTYDSKPTTENAANDDYGLNLQVTWIYH